MVGVDRWWIALPIAMYALACHGQPVESLRFSELAGWWSADPTYGGESSRVALHFLEKDGHEIAELSLPGIGAHGVALGALSINGDKVDTGGFSFPLTWNAERQTLNGLMPHNLVPLYDVPLEFHRGEGIDKPAPPEWKTAKPTLKWSVDAGAPVWAGIERDAQTGLLFVGNEQGVLSAIDASGTVQWRFETGKSIRGRPAVIHDDVYVTSDAGFLYKLNKRTGQEKWRARIDAGSPERIPTNQANSRWDRYGSSAVANGQRLFVASRDKNLYAIDIRTGREIWRVTTADMMTATPAVYRDLVLFAAFDGKVQAVAASDGKIRWSYDAKLAVPGDLAVEKDRVLVGSRTYELIALDAATGTEQWKHYYWFSWIESPPMVRDGVIYTGSSDAIGVYAINASDGSLRWKATVPGWAWARTAVSDDFVVAGTVGAGAYPGFRSGSLVALDRRSGNIRWVYLEPPSQDTIDARKDWGFAASPVIADGVVYAVDLDGRLYAFQLGFPAGNLKP